MSGPKVFSLEEQRIRQEIEERLIFLQNIYRLDEVLKRQRESFNGISEVLDTIKNSSQAKEFLKTVAACRRELDDLRMEKDGFSFNSGNDSLKKFVSKMEALTNKNGKNIEKLKGQVSGLRDRYSKTISECLMNLDSLRSQASKVLEIQKKMVAVNNNEEARQISKDLDVLTDSIRSLQKEWDRVSSSKSLEEIESFARSISEELEKNKSIIEESLSKAGVFLNEKMKQLLDSIRTAKNERCQSNDSKSGYTFYKRMDMPEQFVRDEVSLLFKELDSLQERSRNLGINQEGKYQKLKNKINDVLNQKTWRNNEKFETLSAIDTLEIEPLAEEILKTEIEHDDLDSKLSRELAVYYSICEEYGVTPQQFPFSAASIYDIKYATASIVKNNISEENKLRIATIRKVLEEKYHYIGETVADGCIKQIYKMPYLNETYVHVCITPMGSRNRVTIEVVAKDDYERLPQENEVKEILKGQEFLCNDFEDIRKGFSSAGFGTMIEKKCDPGEKYARVVDTSSYKKEEDNPNIRNYTNLKSYETKYLKV